MSRAAPCSPGEGRGVRRGGEGGEGRVREVRSVRRGGEGGEGMVRDDKQHVLQSHFIPHQCLSY